MGLLFSMNNDCIPMLNLHVDDEEVKGRKMCVRVGVGGGRESNIVVWFHRNF